MDVEAVTSIATEIGRINRSIRPMSASSIVTIPHVPVHGLEIGKDE